MLDKYGSALLVMFIFAMVLAFGLGALVGWLLFL